MSTREARNNWTMRWSLESKIRSGFSFALLIVSVIGVISYRSIVRMTESTRMVTHTHAVLEQIGTVLVLLQDAENDQRRYVISGSPRDFGPYDGTVTRLHNHLIALRELTVDDSDLHRRLDALEPLIEQRLAILGEGVALRRNEGFGAAQRFIESDKGRPAMDAARTLIAAMETRESDLLERRSEAAAAAARVTATVIPLGSLLAFALVAASTLIVHRDLAERRRAERALSQRNAVLQNAVEGIAELDSDGRYLAVNTACAGALLYTPAELAGKLWQFTVHPDDRERAIAAYEEMLHCGRASIEVRGVRKDGSAFPEQVVLVRADPTHGDASTHHCFTRDLSELKRAEVRFRQLFESAPEAMVIVDGDGRIVLLNSSTEQLLGYSREEILGEPIEVLIPEHLRAVHGNHRERYAQTPRPRRMAEARNLYGRRKDGTEFPVEISLSPLETAEGALVSAVLLDVSERRRAEAELKHAKEVAESASRAKSEFLASMSHEIRTPMNGIIGMAELALDTDLTPDAREYLAMVKASADSLLDVINDILDFSKIEAGKLDLEVRDFVLRDIVGDTLKTLAIRAQKKGLELACRINPEVPEILVGDGGRLRQVIVNLVGNAIKFTERGDVTVAVEIESPAPPSALGLHFTVTDTGVGIPAERQRAIFDSFEQADSTTTRKYGGTGLGLAISSRLVDMMGGHNWVESQVGRGSTFHFTARFAVPTAAEHAAIELSPFAGLRVLVVDDSAAHRHILEQMVAGLQMRPILADGGPAALDAMRRSKAAGTPFALALVDAHMPGMDGFALIEKAREGPPLADTIIMMLDVIDPASQVARCRTLGVVTHLTKPIKQSDLHAAIAATLGKPTLTDDGPTRTVPVLLPANRHLHILLTEDNAINQTLAVRLLGKRGHTVVVADNGREALAAFEKEAFDLVLMDVHMAEMDGLEATAAIRAKERATNTHTPIVAMTADAMTGDRERCIEAGMDAYVSKPIEPARLFAVIESLVAVTAAATRPVAATPTLAGTTTGPVIDTATLMERLDGDTDLLQGIVRLFRHRCPALLSSIRSAIDRRDARALELAAHSLRGSVSMLAASAAADAARELEVIGRCGDLSSTDPACARLETEIRRLEATLATLA